MDGDNYPLYLKHQYINSMHVFQDAHFEKKFTEREDDCV